MSQMLEARLAGPQDRVAICPFQTASQIARLAPRDPPYWHHLLVGRHIGIHRPDGRHCNWTARILTHDRRYIQRCLGPALDLGRGCISYLEAVDAAFKWFEACAATGQAAKQAPRGRTDALCFSSIGSTYTVGHALHDYCAWSKIARSKGGHYNMITLSNHHLTHGVTHVPLEEFTAQHLQAIALQIIRTPPHHGFAKRLAPVDRDDLTADELRRRKRTYNSIVGILKVAFSHAWDAGKIETDRPIRCLKRISVVHTPRLLFLNRDECRALLSKCTPALRNLVLAGLYTGCRVGELANLRVEDVGHQIFGIRIGAPPADIIDQDHFEIGGAVLDVLDQLLQGFTAFDPQPTLPGVGIRTDQFETAFRRIFADRVRLVFRRVLLVVGGHADVLGRTP
jgi:integrase/recombinase XerD